MSCSIHTEPVVHQDKVSQSTCPRSVSPSIQGHLVHLYKVTCSIHTGLLGHHQKASWSIYTRSVGLALQDQLVQPYTVFGPSMQGQLVPLHRSVGPATQDQLVHIYKMSWSIHKKSFIKKKKKIKTLKQKKSFCCG